MDCGVSSQERSGDVHFTVRWSPLRKADRWNIAASVPAVGGIYEVYWMDDHRHLRMLMVGHARYGGLRSELRRLTDPELTQDPGLAAILSDKEIWYRYATTDSALDMADLVWYFRKTYFPENPGVSHSGRYKRMYMNESAPDKVLWVP